MIRPLVPLWIGLLLAACMDTALVQHTGTAATAAEGLLSIAPEHAMVEIPPAHPWDIARLIGHHQQKLSQQPVDDSAASAATTMQGGGGRRALLEDFFAGLLTDSHTIPDPVYLQPPAAATVRAERTTTDIPAGSAAVRAERTTDIPAGSAAAAASAGGPALGDDDGGEAAAAAGAVAMARSGRGRSNGRRKCALFTDAAACRAFLVQPRQPFLPVPRGNATCGIGGHGCGFGNCHHDLGLCMCPAGWTGVDCSQPLKRPCTHRTRGPGDPVGLPISHIHNVTKQV